MGTEKEISNLNLESKSIKDTYIEELSKILPQVITEASTADGNVKKAIDFEKLKALLGSEVADTKDIYNFSWVGKKEAIEETGRVTRNTLKPDLEESVDFENTGNVFVSGDNLEVLKILQESYLNKIDMIYIDPPYNTGKDFVYSDKFEQSIKEWDEATGRVDEEGRVRVGNQKNTRESGRFHSNWLNMMYPRLALARNLLKESGVIFISIDDNEQANLKQLCDEIFGEENFLTIFNRKTKSMTGDDGNGLNIQHEYLLVYGKTKKNVNFIGEEKSFEGYANPDNDPNGIWCSGDPSAKSGGESTYFPIVNPYTGLSDYPPEGRYWAFSKETMEEYIKSGRIKFKEKYPETQRGFIFKRYASNTQNMYMPVDTLIFNSNEFMNSVATSELKERGLHNLFSYPKPVGFIKSLIKYSSRKNAVILDFFVGSGTTADAVMQLNAEDGGNRKYIVCTLDEEVDEKSAAKEAGYETIDQISRERIRRAAAKIKEENPEKAEALDLGFKAFKVETSNYENVYKTTENYNQASLLDSISSIKEGRSELDLLYQVMLSWGLELSEKITSEEIDGTKVYTVGDKELVACFSENLSDEVIETLAKRKVKRVVFRDDSFVNSSAKINLNEIFKEFSPTTRIKVI